MVTLYPRDWASSTNEEPLLVWVSEYQWTTPIGLGIKIPTSIGLGVRVPMNNHHSFGYQSTNE